VGLALPVEQRQRPRLGALARRTRAAPARRSFNRLGLAQPIADAMISALRKIEGRGDLEGANSAVMEMCIDNPRADFTNIFDTHPPVAARVEALVKYAGGHDPGPIALPPPGEPESEEEPEQASAAEGQSPWDAPAPAPAPGKPFLPERPPVELGAPRPGAPSGPQPWGPAAPPTDPGTGGPWGPRR
jgi:heat shock protein HtpX